MDDIQHRSDQLGTLGDGGLARLKIDLHTLVSAEILQNAAEFFQRVAVFRKINTAAKADPYHPLQQRSVFSANLLYGGGDIS